MVVSEVVKDMPSKLKAALSMAPRMVLMVSTLTLVAVSSLGLTVVVDLNTLMASPKESTDSKVAPCDESCCWPWTNNQGHTVTKRPT